MKKVFLGVLFSINFSNLFTMDSEIKKDDENSKEKVMKIHNKEFSQSSILEIIENLKKLKKNNPLIFYKLVQKCRSNQKCKSNLEEDAGCHIYPCPKGGVIVSKYGLNFHDFYTCGIITKCVKIDGVNYNIINPFESDTEIDQNQQLDEEHENGEIQEVVWF